MLPSGQLEESADLVSPPGYSTAYIAGLDAAADGNTAHSDHCPDRNPGVPDRPNVRCPEPQNQDPIIIARINGGATQWTSPRWTAAPLQPIVGGPSAPSRQQVRLSGNFPLGGD